MNDHPERKGIPSHRRLSSSICGICLLFLFSVLLLHGQIGLRDPAFIASTASAVAITPASFAGLTDWWDANFLTLTNNALVGTEGNVAVAWTNRVPNTNYLGHQVVPANSPIFKTNIINGKHVVRWSGNQALGMNTAGGRTFVNNWTVIAVMSVNADSLLLGQQASNQQIRHRITTLDFSFNAGAIGFTSTTLSTAVSTPGMFVWRMDSTVAQFRENKSSRTGAPAGTGVSIPFDVMGITFPFSFNLLNGDVAEVVIYNTALSDANCDSLYDNYFKPKFGLP